MKKNIINYSGSFIKTFRVFSKIVLVICIAATLLLPAWMFFRGDQPTVILLVFLPRLLLYSGLGVFLFLILLAISKVLEHLYFIRKYLEKNYFEEIAK